MPDDTPLGRRLTAADMGPTERLLAELVFEPVRARFQLMQRKGTLTGEHARQIRKLLPKLPKVCDPSEQVAFDIISAVQVLRKALSGEDLPAPVDLGQAQDIDADELPDEQPHLSGGLGRAD